MPGGPAITRRIRDGSNLPVFAAVAATILVGTVVAALPARAQSCPLALVLAVDASSSVDSHEYRLQAQGIANAFADPDVEAAILAGGGILAMVFEWSGRRHFRTHADWTWLDSRAAIAGFADKVARAQRRTFSFPTALGHALGHSAIQHRRAPMECHRRVIDVSGDGVNNEGFGPASAYRAQDFSGITVNGLVIKGGDPDPEDYYVSQVIRGQGAFVEIAADYEDYARAMRRKLLREIGGLAVSHSGN